MLTDRQITLCTESRWDFSDLKALFLNCTLKRSPEQSHTEGLIAIARALMSRPRLLLLDEPSLGLAPRVVQEVFEVVERISREGVTILLVEQNLHRALAISDRSYVLETGRIVREGSSAALAADESIRSAYLGL